jgi:hypothetical protein
MKEAKATFKKEKLKKKKNKKTKKPRQCPTNSPTTKLY